KAAESTEKPKRIHVGGINWTIYDNFIENLCNGQPISESKNVIIQDAMLTDIEPMAFEMCKNLTFL
ncbi:hypothetical protein TrispH2_011347, partial [Trichoplax sp. H2]